MSELKKCPFCGGEANCNNTAVMQCGEFKWAVECPQCGVITGAYNTEKEAAAVWNRRIDESAEKGKRIAELQAENRNLQVHADYCESERDAWEVEVERLQAECDAAVADLKTVFGKCSYCKFFKQGAFGGQCQSTPNPGKCWQWRGVQHDSEKED